MSRIFVTGSAGFIGFHLVKALVKSGHHVVGADNLNEYYDVQLKNDRLDDLHTTFEADSLLSQYMFVNLDIANSDGLERLFDQNKFDIVINLAAQAGVRYSLDNPKAYIDANIIGFSNILECCRHHQVKHLLFASSSSVYGMNKKQPFSISDNTDHPISLYAATKKSNELLAHSYSHLFNLPCTGLRFFTVYGPFGRPDMAYYKFTKAIKVGDAIDVYNNGVMERDFTYIDDVIQAITKLSECAPMPQVSCITQSNAPFKIYNIGNNKPVSLARFIASIEAALGIKARQRLLPMQPGDVPVTFADIDELTDKFGLKPNTTIENGMAAFVHWYLAYINDKEIKKS